MGPIHDFLAANREMIFFAYGLIFFVLGLAIVLQTRRSSRLDLARSLRWLALFAILHAFTEWGDLFIPIQSAHVSRFGQNMLLFIQLFLLAGSFTCLFEFGVALLNPLGRALWLHGVPAGLMGGWLFFTFFVLLPTAPDLMQWHHTADALARYFIAFPGGVTAAYALRQNTFKRIAPLNVPAIVDNLRVAGIALFLYAQLAGLIPPPVSFFPGIWLNSDTFNQTLGFPPMILRSVVALVLTITIIRALEFFQLETDRRIEQLEQSQIVTAERERLARELHDGAIQKVYTAGLLVESASRLTNPGSELASRLERAISALNDSIGDLRHNLVELHASSPTSAPSLQQALERLAQDPHYNSLMNVSLKMELPEDLSLSTLRLEHVSAVVNEALANIARHAEAKNAAITALALDGLLRIAIRDDGIGFRPDAPAGYGIRNMRDRARLLNSELKMEALKNKGTLVTFTIPWMDE